MSCVPRSGGLAGCVERLLGQAPAGRQRVKGLAALTASTHEASPSNS